MNYHFLNSFTNRLASAIVKELRGPKANQDGDFVVAVCMAPSDHLVATLLAIWKAGELITNNKSPFLKLIKPFTNLF